jgi:2-polyprenyl-3-methyl-5-hydroxy-6-metoxy-1,4-benzoquinol methylase
MKPKISQFWRLWFLNERKYDTVNRLSVRYHAIEMYIKGKNVLDFCFGSGFFLKKLASSRNYCLYGIDLPNFKRKLPKNVKIFLIKDFDSLKTIHMPIKFDTILVSEVIEHLTLREMRIVFRFFSKWLNKKGRLIISVPYKENIKYSTVLCPYCLRWFHPWLHKQSFDEESLKILLIKRGFVVAKIYYITLLDFWHIPSLLKKITNSLLLTFFKNRFKFIVWIVVIAKKLDMD